ncbi:Hsp20/alpha crystallin family protein [Myxococcota bacterium]|nr:Hsp20/alpha crystallin family protein [Myxococcota bacterium]
MSLVRWDPFRELEDMSDRLNKLFHRPELARPREGMKDLAFADWAPSCDIRETSEEYVIKAELPEVKKEDIKVDVKDGVLSIRGERKIEKEEKDKKYHRIERAYGTFFRSFALPEDVDEKKLAADYKDGVLNVHLPRTPTAKPRMVEVKVN